MPQPSNRRLAVATLIAVALGSTEFVLDFHAPTHGIIAILFGIAVVSTGYFARRWPAALTAPALAVATITALYFADDKGPPERHSCDPGCLSMLGAIIWIGGPILLLALAGHGLSALRERARRSRRGNAAAPSHLQQDSS